MPERLRGWTPIRMSWRGRDPLVDWCYTQGIDFVDPFFDQSVWCCLDEPFRLLFQRHTTLDALADLAAARPGLMPSGLVFHTSRCGSTLVTQMLARLPSVLVMAEPGPLESVLAARSVAPDLSEDQRADWFLWMVSALGQPRRPEHVHYVIKFDAWAVLQLPFIRSLFPDTPAIFLYRDPIEVLVSQAGHRGYHMIPGCLPPELLGLHPAEATSMAPERYMATVLNRLLESVVASPEKGRPTLVHYRQLPGAVTDTIAPLFGIDLGPDGRTVVLEVADQDAKNPSLPWVDDSEDKRRRATDALRLDVRQLVDPLYDDLERLRAAAP
ncbi:MAG: hypothetical protein QOF20_1729 [Acidimicrobiaceae bacterium]|nr:hypothetical protein [Acidimicrobiaceae bacterium]MDQ1412595.1 hypothetical protein [Acidimicrobiaceae bacterium]